MGATLISNNTTIKYNGAAAGKGAVTTFVSTATVYVAPAGYSEVTLSSVITGAAVIGSIYASNDGGITSFTLPQNVRSLIPGGYTIYVSGSAPGFGDTATVSAFGVQFVNTP